jgi:hypothetical protein
VNLNGALHHPQLGDPVATYEYRNIAGDTKFGNARFDPKDFRMFTVTPDGKIRWTIEGAPPLLYQLPRIEEALIKGETIWIVDGEKDADALSDRGHAATCCARAQGWSLELADQLIGARRIKIVADRGGNGMNQAIEVRDLLLQVTGIGSHEIEIVQAAEGKDTYDHFAAGFGIEEFELVNEAQVLGIEENTEPAPIIFETLRSFLERDVPKSESLVGVTRDGTNLLPRYGWVMPWGKEGSGKTSIMVDLMFHACAGMDWLQYPVARPLKIVAIVNEGVPGGLQDKLRQKHERWEHDDAVLDNLAVYASPWGEFTFANERMVQHAKDYCRDFGADYIALDPLHTLGTTGVGSPVETEAFKHILRNFGLWEWIGIITAHHSNKSGMLSGDWGRHPDTVILLEKDGKNPATKFTVHKARPAAPEELGVPFLLEWTIETLGYTRHDIGAPVKVSDDELLQRIKTSLQNAPEPLSMKALQAATEGNATRISTVAKAALGRGEIGNVSPSSGRFLFVPRGIDSTPEESEESVEEKYEQTRMVEPENRFLDPEESHENHPETGQTIPRFLPPRRGGGSESLPLGQPESQDDDIDLGLDWT